MAKYTITIKSLLDNKFDFKMSSYPIFDETYRNILNNNILNHYYENEIGFETAALFRFYLNQTLNEIMPKYNVLYKVQKRIIEKDLLLNNINITENLKRTNNTEMTSNSNSNSTNNGTNDSKNLFLDTPQGQIYKGSIDDANYATNVTFDKNTTSNTISDNSNASGNTNNTENYIKSIIGNSGNKFNIELLNEIKNNIMNIDLMIINELNDLFMQIF